MGTLRGMGRSVSRVDRGSLWSCRAEMVGCEGSPPYEVRLWLEDVEDVEQNDYGDRNTKEP
jgi:hypothetical protein